MHKEFPTEKENRSSLPGLLRFPPALGWFLCNPMFPNLSKRKVHFRALICTKYLISASEEWKSGRPGPCGLTGSDFLVPDNYVDSLLFLIRKKITDKYAFQELIAIRAIFWPGNDGIKRNWLGFLFIWYQILVRWKSQVWHNSKKTSAT